MNATPAAVSATVAGVPPACFLPRAASWPSAVPRDDAGSVHPAGCPGQVDRRAATGARASSRSRARAAPSPRAGGPPWSAPRAGAAGRGRSSTIAAATRYDSSRGSSLTPSICADSTAPVPATAARYSSNRSLTARASSGGVVVAVVLGQPLDLGAGVRRALVDQPQHAEARVAVGHDVGAAVRPTATPCAAAAERADLVQGLHAVLAHLVALADGDDAERRGRPRAARQVGEEPAVARLEDVQRQHEARDEDGAEREQRDHRPRAHPSLGHGASVAHPPLRRIRRGVSGCGPRALPGGSCGPVSLDWAA